MKAVLIGNEHKKLKNDRGGVEEVHTEVALEEAVQRDIITQLI